MSLIFTRLPEVHQLNDCSTIDLPQASSAHAKPSIEDTEQVGRLPTIEVHTAKYAELKAARCGSGLVVPNINAEKSRQLGHG
jgi:hypothetical protein